MNPLTNILEIFRIRKTMRYHGNMNSIEEILDGMAGKKLDREEFYCRKSGELEYTIIPIISLGTVQSTMESDVFYNEGISVNLKLKRDNDNLQRIELSGSLQKGHYVIVLSFIICTIVTIANISKMPWWVLLFIPVLWIISHLWFNYVWTSQEKELINELKLALHVRIKAGIK